MLVRGTGWVGAANAVGVVGFGTLLLALFAMEGRWFPYRWFLTFCLAVPLFVLHFSIGYVDLVGACFFAIGFLGYIGLAEEKRIDLSAALAIAGLTAAMFTKFQLWPPCAVLGAFVFIRITRLEAKQTLKVQRGTLLKILLVLCLLLFPLRNKLLYGNPAYPYQPPFVPWSLPAATSLTFTFETPPALRSSPPVIQFVHSALELNRLSPSSEPYQWSFDEIAPAQSPHRRMGGWFFATVIVLALLTAYGVLRKIIPGWVGWAHLLTILAFVVLPHSHELRYGLFIPIDSILLLCLYLVLYPPVWKKAGLTALAACAVFVVWTLRVNILTFDLRPPSSFPYYVEHLANGK
jgi:hypothetical protein